MNHNSVARLRLQELAKARRPFLARGCKTVRCPDCLLAEANCICASRPAPQGQCAVLFIMYHGEVFKPSNTGRLIADVIADNHAFQWERTVHDPALLALLADERYAPIVVFPHQYAEPGHCIHTPAELVAVNNDGKIPLFVLLDGTWREAKKMFFKSPYLQNLPVLGIQPEEASSYRLREAYHLHQLCTAEVFIEVLRLAGDEAASGALAGYFDLFRERYLAGKASTGAEQQAQKKRDISAMFGMGEPGEF
ncbi:tRNA-uridine aminocarboxypropyltransferase [Thalassolituus sp. LLYu03]|uniref:tRNA-uridine aminocarboxypropyltransferase n=1 Tax=Thalassolituus sp. LLYu03 TaxID=3421656 RepID=UPI003D2A5C34